MVEQLWSDSNLPVGLVEAICPIIRFKCSVYTRAPLAAHPQKRSNTRLI